LTRIGKKQHIFPAGSVKPSKGNHDDNNFEGDTYLNTDNQKIFYEHNDTGSYSND